MEEDILGELHDLSNHVLFVNERAIGKIASLSVDNDRLRQQVAELVAEPSIKMLLAGKKALFRVVEDPTIDDARSVYEAMIAACKATGGE